MSGAAVECIAADSFAWDLWQTDAMRSIDDGRSVLVSAPTGAGKTAIAEHAVRQALEAGRKAVYTTPIKALSNQKYRDFSEVHGRDSVGLLTGDVTVSPEAPLIVMTTEVLRNMLISGKHDDWLGSVAWVVLDEVHYLQDRDRGAVWEEILIHAPGSINFVCLSGTISNHQQFGDWLNETRAAAFDVISHDQRPVPLSHWHFVTDNINGSLRRSPMLNKEGNPNIKVAKKIDCAERRMYRSWDDDDWRFSTPSAATVMKHLKMTEQLPALWFVFSRDGCERAAGKAWSSRPRLTTDQERERIRELWTEKLAPLTTADQRAAGSVKWLMMLLDGIAVHHAGLLPLMKEAVEECFDAGLVKVVFATETMALGVNMPAKTVVVERLTKWDGSTHRELTPMQYSQIAGRAGRRGIDTEGNVISLWSPHFEVERAARLAASRKFDLRSSFRPNYNMCASLVSRYDRPQVELLVRRSYAAFLSRHRPPARGKRKGGPPPSKEDRLVMQFRSAIDLLGDYDCVDVDAWALTDKGQMLSGIRHENDLLITETVHSGCLDDLGVEELAATVSAIINEPRKGIVVGARQGTPAARVFDIAERLSKDELRRKLTLTKTPDGRLMKAARVWASGGTLSDVMSKPDRAGNVIAPGDFARHILILADVLSQIAATAPSESLRRKASSAASNLVRGPVAAGTSPLAQRGERQ